MKTYTMKHKTTAKILATAIAIMLAFTGCSGAQASASASGSDNSAQASVTYDAASKSEMFTDRDLSGDYDEAEALKITLNGTSAEIAAEGSQTTSAGVSIDGSTITITEEGTYILSGTLTDGMVIVDADDSAKVQIVLDDASITSSTSAAIYVKSADKVFITTADGTSNTLANGGEFTAIDDNNIDGAVFAKDDITINGSGILTVTSPAGHGIVGKDDVKIAGGTITVTAAKHGIQANDSVRLASADVYITAGTDGVHVSDNADEENGTASDSYFYIADATVTISAGDDGIHADAQALIEGGKITINESYEGIEALDIEISGGDIDLKATDDGINASGGNATTTSSNSAQGNIAGTATGNNADTDNNGNDWGTFGDDDWFGGKGGFPGGGFSDGGTDGIINISGGNIHIQASGDGIDANGSVEISGGTTIVEGPTNGDTSVIDFNTTGTITGGTFIGTGGAGMAQSFTSAENQGLIQVATGNQSSGTTITLKDSDGNVIAEQTPELDYAVVYISTSELKTGGTYTLTAGSYSETIDLTDSIYSTISGGMMGGGRMNGGRGGDMQNDGNFGGGMQQGNDQAGDSRNSGDLGSDFGKGQPGDMQSGDGFGGGRHGGKGRGHGDRSSQNGGALPDQNSQNGSGSADQNSQDGGSGRSSQGTQLSET